MQILIAEDNIDSRIYLDSLLSGSGYSTLSAENGKLALDLARKHKPDLIISDIMMPHMDGYQFCKAVKTDPNLSNIPFIFYTATYTDPKDQRLAMELGAEKFMLKPMEIDHFLEEVELTLATLKTVEVVKQPILTEENFQQNYSEVLAKKLDSKVSQLVEEQQKLAYSENKYKRLIEVLSDEYFFYSHSIDNLFQYVSPSINCILGYDQDEFRSDFKSFFVEEESKAIFFNNLELSLSGLKSEYPPIKLYHKNGNTHIFEITENVLKDENGDVVSVEGIAHKITDRIIAEQKLSKANERLRQSQKMEAIGTLAGGIAHDFNNILSAIFGLTELSQLVIKDQPEVSDNLDSILNAAERAKDLVRQILSFSRQNSQEKQPVLLSCLSKEALKLIRASLPSSINIITKIDKNCPPVLANSTQIHQIIMNLCTNAYHAMKDKGGTLALSVEEIVFGKDDYIVDFEIKPGKYVKLEVSDTGVGIPKDKHAKIFEPYYTSKPKDEGTGLGLSVVHGIVKDHNGYIALYSEINRGSTFQIYFPIIESNKKENCHSNKKANYAHGTEKIMLVDDEEIIGSLEKKILQSLGYDVVAFTSSIKALSFFEKNHNEFDLVITDMTMPGLSGADFTKKIHQINRDFPVIICTGFSELIDKKKAIELGVKDYVMKPISIASFSKTIRDVLDHS
jgi:PAS domain S-box-containing protein